MSLPRRQIPAFPRVWAPGRSSGVLVLFWTMIFWGSAQTVLWFAKVSDPLDWVSLDPAAIGDGEFWRLFTYQFLHAGVGHFMVNLLVLWFAGREIEPIVGRHHFLALCLVANLVGGLLNLLVPAQAIVVGFSAAAAAVLVAYATIMPELEQTLSFFFLFPLRFRAKYFAAAMILFGIVCLATGTMGELGPAGILAGSIIGWAWARKLGFGNPLWFQRIAFERRQRALRIERMSAEDFISLEIDPILDKISRDGMRSLTRAERRLLEQGRKKIAIRTAGKI
ncbi:MAG: rhomboid family intramembrane serine protease [Chthoniobacteraceae bacterium]